MENKKSTPIKIELRLYKRFDCDLLAIHDLGISISKLASTVLEAYAKGVPVRFFVTGCSYFELDDRRGIHLSFLTKSEESAMVIRRIRPGFRNQFVKTLIRNSLVFEPMWPFLASKKRVREENRRLESVYSDYQLYGRLEEAKPIPLLPEKKKSRKTVNHLLKEILLTEKTETHIDKPVDKPIEKPNDRQLESSGRIEKNVEKPEPKKKSEPAFRRMSMRANIAKENKQEDENRKHEKTENNEIESKYPEKTKGKTEQIRENNGNQEKKKEPNFENKRDESLKDKNENKIEKKIEAEKEKPSDGSSNLLAPWEIYSDTSSDDEIDEDYLNSFDSLLE